METEKITINLGMLEVGKIDVLVENGLFSNRSDFIRTAVRERLAVYEAEIKEFANPPVTSTDFYFTMGVAIYGYSVFTLAVEKGKKLRIVSIGVIRIDKQVDAQLFKQAVSSIKVYGKIIASDEIKEVIKYMEERSND